MPAPNLGWMATLRLRAQNIYTMDPERNTSYKVVDLSDNPLQSLDFLEKFPGCEDLRLENVGLQSFDDLVPLGKLRKLRLSRNRLENFSCIKAYPNLEQLELDGNPFAVGSETTFRARLPRL